MFYFPAMLALLLREHTWMSGVAITNCLRRRALDREDFTILRAGNGRQPNRHYYVRPVPGGFLVFPTQMPTGYMS